jgi:hypothetical protein
MSEVKLTIIKTFERYTPGVKVDQKMVKYWDSSISKGDKSLEDFFLYLANSVEYTSHVKTVLTNMYYEHMANCDVDVHDFFESMLEVNKDKLMSDVDVWNYVASSLQFEQQHRDLVLKLWRLQSDQDPTEREIQSLINLFKEDQTFSIGDLQTIVESRSKTTPISNTTLDDDDVSIATTPDNVDFSFTAPEIEENIDNDLEIVQEYEKVFERNMNVREYIHYIKKLRMHRNDPGYIPRMYEKHNVSYQQVKEILNVYVDRYLLEDTFINEYIKRLDEPGFLDALRLETINSSEYEQKMCKKIQGIYQSMFGEKMTMSDTMFLFERAKGAGLELTSDELNEKVAEFRIEHDEITQSIFDMYLEIYDRQPDNNELMKHTMFIRTNGPMSMSRIVFDMKDSLEFHDVIKKKISKIYSKQTNESIFPSKLYAVLNIILPNKYADDIDNQIEKAIKDMQTT